jgi:lysophospholipase L1-like esterase
MQTPIPRMDFIRPARVFLKRGSPWLHTAVFTLLVVWPCAAAFAQAEAEAESVSESKSQWDELLDASPWVFLGDSNTYSGGYIAMLDAWLNSDQGSKPKVRLLNLGMSSETASGLSEVDHPFKRPCIHERLEKILTVTQPKVVFICYGMNDGIYQPPNSETQMAYEVGMLKLAKRIKQSGAKVICLTPPIFEPEPVAAKGQLGPSAAGRFAYFAPSKIYDETLGKQAAWCLKNEFFADAVIDIRSLLIEEKQRMQEENADFAYSGDGVHFGDVAHGLIAEKILATLGAPSAVIAQYPSAEALAAASKRMQLLRDAYLSATGKNRPGLAAGYPVWYAEQLAKQVK